MSYLVNPVSWRSACVLYWNMVTSVSKFNYFYINLLHIQLSLFIGFFFTRLRWSAIARRKKSIIRRTYKKGLRSLLRSQKYYRSKFFVKLDVLYVTIYFFRKRRLKRRKRRWGVRSLDWRTKKCLINPPAARSNYRSGSSFPLKLSLRRDRYKLFNFTKRKAKFDKRRWRECWKNLKLAFIEGINRTEMSHPYPRLYYRKVILRRRRRARLDNFFDSLMFRFNILSKFAYKMNRFLVLVYIKKILYFFIKSYFFVDAVLFFFFYRRRLQLVRSQYILNYVKYRLVHRRESISRALRKLRLRLGVFWKKQFFGLKIVFAGRNRRRNRAIYSCKQYGVLPLSSKCANIDFYTDSIINHYGIMTIKVWLYRNNV